MRALVPVVFVFALAAAAAAQEASSCVTHCHGAEATAFKGRVHSGHLACTDCHGGNPAAHRDKAKSHDKAAGYVGNPPRAKIPELCGSCHADTMRMHAFALPTDQLEHYRESAHGKALAKGDTTVAVCTDCHGVHGILPTHDPRAPTSRANQAQTCGRCHADPVLMKKHALPADSVERYLGSVHGIALAKEGSRGAPACSDCHGSHAASPPGANSIVQICGNCHPNTADHFRHSPHAKDPASLECASCHEEKGHAFRGSGCVSCHGQHMVRTPGAWMYEGDEIGHCGHCHRTEDGATRVIDVLQEGRGRLEKAIARTEAAISDAKAQGVFLEHEAVYLRDSQRALVLLQPLAHSVDATAISKHLEDGVKRQDRVEEAIATRRRVLRDRQIIVAGIVALLLLLAALLGAKLRGVRRLS